MRRVANWAKKKKAQVAQAILDTPDVSAAQQLHYVSGCSTLVGD
jgi:hypothetical protein